MRDYINRFGFLAQEGEKIGGSSVTGRKDGEESGDVSVCWGVGVGG